MSMSGVADSRSAPHSESLSSHGSLTTFLTRSCGVLLIKMLGVLAVLGWQLFVARSLGVAAFGLFAAISSLLVMATQLGKLGLEPTTLRFVAAYRATKSAALLAGFRHFRARALRTSQLVGVGVAALVLAMPFLGLSTGTWWAILIAVGMWSVALVLEVAMADLRACGWTQRSELIAMVLRPTLSALTLGVLLVLGCTASAAVALTALGVTYVLLLILASFVGRAAHSDEPLVAPDESEKPQWRQAAGFFTWFALLQAILTQADIGVVGLLVGNDAAGKYAAAARLAQLATLGLMTASAIGAPLLAGTFAQANLPRLQQLVQRMALVAAMLMLPALVVLAIFGRTFLSVFGEDFVAGYVPMLILLLGQFVNAITGSAGQLLNMTGHHRDTARAQTLVAVLQLILLAVLTPLFGAIGAASASAICLTLWNLQAVWLVRRRLNINSTIISRDLFRSLLRS